MQLLRGGSKTPQKAQTFLSVLWASQAACVAFGLLSGQPAQAQGLDSGSQVGAFRVSNNFLALEPAAIPSIPRGTPTTILPTDVVPLPAAEQRMTVGENLQLRVLQRLPARSYFNLSCETSFRDETNPFQFPTRRQFIKRFMSPPPVFRELPLLQQISQLHTLSQSNINNVVFRVLPNVTGGWTITPKTRFFGNYFMIRDSLMHSVALNTTIQSVAYGIQQDIPVTRRGNLQMEFQVRSLFQQSQSPVYDFLPALTFSYILTPRTVIFANTLLQLRGNGYYQSPTREMDPFYTFGALYQKGAYSFSANATLVTNYRQLFGRNAAIRQDNYSWILDFEIAKRLFKQMPGLQAFFRAEPIYNFKSQDTPGLAGMDFRAFWGLRMAMGKPPLTAALNQIREQLEEQEGVPPPPEQAPGEKPSAWNPQNVASAHQPIHGYLTDSFKLHKDTQEEPSNLLSMHGIVLDTTRMAATAKGSDLIAAEPSAQTIAGELEKGRQRIILADAANFAHDLPLPAQARTRATTPSIISSASRTAKQTTLVAYHASSSPIITTGNRTQVHTKQKVTAIWQAKPIAKNLRHAQEKPLLAHAEPQAEKFFIHQAQANPAPSHVLRHSVQVSTPRRLAQLDFPAKSSASTKVVSKAHYEFVGNQGEPVDALHPIASQTSANQISANQAKQTEVSSANNQHVRMVVMPPLPRVHPESKDNPFPEAKEHLTPPIMMH
jgi:hypothetical protein